MENKEKVKYRETLLVIVLGFSVLYLILDRNWMLYTALGVGMVGMLSAQLNRWIHQAWFFMGEKIGFVVSKVLLGALFFIVLIPMSLIARVFRKDIMHLKAPSASAYHQRDHLYEPADLENMW
ncbi:MAG: SxtJ family membrane protein [Bacteroidota bacterium]